MKRYDKRMILLVVVAVVLLAVKSTWFDPVAPEDMSLQHYSEYALLAASLQSGITPPPAWLYTYRTVAVTRLSQDGTTVVLLPETDTNLLKEVVLQGQYQAKVRAYLLYLFPVKHIMIEGGVANDASTSKD